MYKVQVNTFIVFLYSYYLLKINLNKKWDIEILPRGYVSSVHICYFASYAHILLRCNTYDVDGQRHRHTVIHTRDATIYRYM